jgi:hypothetical protein
MKRRKGMVQLPYKDREKDELDLIIDRSWSMLCDLENWLDTLARRPGTDLHLTKPELKLMLKGMINELDLIHYWAAIKQEDRDGFNSDDKSD